MGEGCKLYIGNLDHAAERRDLEDAFGKFGAVEDVWVARKPPGFAFVTFGDARDADDAVKEMDGEKILKETIRVEHSKGGQKRAPPGARQRRFSRSRSPQGQRYRSRSRDRRRSPSYDRRDRKRDDRRERKRSRSRDDRRERKRSRSRDRSRDRRRD